MNSQLAIVILIDVEAALKAGTLHNNTYLIDNFRFMGSTGQGSGQLTTAVVGNQIMNWLVSGIDISGGQPTPVLESIGGEAVERQIMVPQLFDSPALDGNMGYWWGATVDAITPGKYSYTLHFDIAGTKMEFISTIDIQSGFTMEPVPPKAVAGRPMKSASSDRTTIGKKIINPDDHLSLFTKNQIDTMKNTLNKAGR